MDFRILGPLEVDDDGRRLLLGGHQQRALLALLLLRANEVVPVEQVIEGLWPTDPPLSATKSVHALVSKLRRTLEGEPAARAGEAGENGVLLTRPHGYLLTVVSGERDLDRFQFLLDEGRRALTAGRSADAAATIREALALWRGPPLAEFAYESFAQVEIARLEELRLSALEERIEADLALGRQHDLIPEVEALVAKNPFRERLRGQLMLALYRSGRQAEALDAYQRTRHALVDQLGIEPGQALLRLEAQILNHDPVLDRPVPVERALLRSTAALRRRWPLVVLAVLLLAGALVAAAIELTRSSRNSGSRASAGDSVAAIDPRNRRIAKRISVGNTPSSIVVGEGSVWALNADDGTVSKIDPKTRRLTKTFGTGGLPTDVAVGAGAIWVGNGFQDQLASGVPTTFARTITRIDSASTAAVKTIELSQKGGVRPSPGRSPGQTHIAVGKGVIWVINPDQSVSRIDPVTNRVAATVRSLTAGAIATGLGAVWALDNDQNSLIQISTQTNAVTARLPLPAGSLNGIAVGAGAIWVTDPFGGSVWRIDPGPPLITRTIPVGLGVSGIAVGEGAVWASNDWADTISRIDTETNRVTDVVEIGSPQGVTVGDGTVWATTKALSRASCGTLIYGGEGSPKYVIVSDLPLQGADRTLTSQAAAGIALVLRQHRYRAGRYTVGYRSCDDSTAQAGSFDFGKCIANAKAYAADSRVIGVIGTYNSGCAEVEIPIANQAANGPLAIVSGWNTFTFLTRRAPEAPPNMLRWLYPTGTRNYARIIAEDRVQLAAGALLAQKLGAKRVFLLASASSEGRETAKLYRQAAAKIGLKIVGAAAWNPRAAGYSKLVDQVNATRPDAVLLGGSLFQNGGRVVRELRSALRPRVRLIAPDTFLPISDLLRAAGPAAIGMYVTSAGTPNAYLPPVGKRFLKRFRAAHAAEEPVSLGAAYAAQAAEVLLAAIARSDGSRASVTRALLATRVRAGIVGSFQFDRYGDTTSGAITVYRVVGGHTNPTGLPAFLGSVVDGVITPPPGALATR